MKKQELYEFLCASQSMAFLGREAQEMADAVLRARPEYAPYLTDQALRDLQNGCRARLNQLYLFTVSEKIFTAAQAIDPVAAANPDRADPEVLARADAMAAETMGADPAAAIREELPVLREYEERIRRYAVEARTEFLDNVFRYREILSARFFGGREIRKIESLTDTGSDVHRKGRSVMGVRTDAGTFYYKPHDCRIDALYREIAERFFPDCTTAADCVPGDGCGFVTEIVSSPLEGTDQLHAYYRNFGMLTALLHGIGATDMHCENILPCGVRPAAVDLETMLTPKRRRSARSGDVRATVHETALSIGGTVLRTGIMPFFIHTLGVITPLYPSLMGDYYMPYTGGAHHSVLGYEEDYLAGFREGYRRVLSHAEEIKALLNSYGGAQLRYLLRNSAFYSNLQSSLFRRKNLASREAQEAVLHQLEVPYRQNGLEVDHTLVRYETGCLLDGDIPYYCVTLDGKALCGASPGEVLHDRFMELSARERTFSFLDRLTEPELTLETGLIRHYLKAVPYAEEDPAEPDGFPSSLPDRQRVTGLLQTIADDIRDRAIPMPDGSALWLSSMPAQMTAAGDCGRATYSADAGRCIARMKKAGISGLPETLAEKCLDTVDEALSLWEREEGGYLRANLPTDWLFGLAGLLSACDDLAAAGFIRAEDSFCRLTGILDGKEFHIADGPEDLLIALGQSRTETSAKAVLAMRLGERLRETGRSGRPTAVRTASAAAAFAAACRLTGEDRFAADAAEAISGLCDRFTERIAGWPDENAVLPWLAPRGTQAAWIALRSADARDWLAGRKEQEKAEKLLTLSLKSLISETGLWYNDSLCHGNALAVLALIRASGVRKNPEYLERAGFILEAMLNRYDRKGSFTVCQKGIHSFFDISFSCGTTGIGAVAADWLAETAGIWTMKGETDVELFQIQGKKAPGHHL